MADPDDAVEIFDELYPYFEATGAARGPAWAKFFLEAGPADDPLFSHQTRVAATAGVKAFYAADVTPAHRRGGSPGAACATRCRRSSPGGARWRRRRTSR